MTTSTSGIAGAGLAAGATMEEVFAAEVAVSMVNHLERLMVNPMDWQTENALGSMTVISMVNHLC